MLLSDIRLKFDLNWNGGIKEKISEMEIHLETMKENVRRCSFLMIFDSRFKVSLRIEMKKEKGYEWNLWKDLTAS